MENVRDKILSFNDLEIGFDTGKVRRSLLRPVKGSAYEGELISLVGRNGIGKSTLLRTLTGLQESLGGEIYLDSRNLREFKRVQLSEQVGYISTEKVSVSNLRVYDLVSFGRFPYTNWLGNLNKTDDEKIKEAVKNTGLNDLVWRSVNELSDGERQRAMIAMTLAQDARLMVMDEPTAFLDINGKYEIMHLLYEITRSRNKTIIFSTHDLNIAISQADKVWLLTNNGLIEGAPEDLMLAGEFDNLFDNSKVKFNKHDGSFNLRNIEKGVIGITGKGALKYWTEKALTRAGYRILNSGSDLIVEVPSDTDTEWKLHKPGKTIRFNTIYELICCIREIRTTS